jgi:hypothetical protein
MIKHLNKPSKLTGTHPVTRRTPHVTTSEQRKSHTVISQVTEMTQCAPVMNAV